MDELEKNRIRYEGLEEFEKAPIPEDPVFKYYVSKEPDARDKKKEVIVVHVQSSSNGNPASVSIKIFDENGHTGITVKHVYECLEQVFEEMKND